ncbi:unnamed protein product [Phyllotreta striolata]|uniref:Uncharacterized protein n=1 Tax=Phyllotreta striolata TaxID=444603 RepID=A0A9N9TQV5_PHYSR|nr:unnamed protein product [Phyllotreta striolata]
MSKRLKRLRFSYEDEISLLKEFLAHNPLLHPEKWSIIQENVAFAQGKTFSIRTLREHVQLLIQTRLKPDSTIKNNSYKDVPPYERDSLLHKMLQDIDMLYREFELHGESTKRGKQLRIKKSNGMRDSETCVMDCYSNETSNMLPENSLDEHCYTLDIKDPRLTQTYDAEDGGASPQNASRRNELDYLSNRYNKDLDNRDRELELQEKKLKLEEKRLGIEEKRLEIDEKKFELEILERQQKMELEKQRFDLECKERNVSLNLIQSQQNIISNLIQSLNKKFKS